MKCSQLSVYGLLYFLEQKIRELSTSQWTALTPFQIITLIHFLIKYLNLTALFEHGRYKQLYIRGI